MRFAKVDDTLVGVYEMNLEDVARIAEAFELLVKEGYADERDNSLGKTFRTAFEKFSVTEVAEQTEESA